MGTAPTPVLVSTYGTGNSVDGKITRDPIDDLIGAMSSHLLLYLRAKKLSGVPAAFSDALGNSVSCTNTGDCTFTASDTKFGNHSSITFGGGTVNNIYTVAAGNIGIGLPPQPMTNSFTILTGINAGNSTGGNSIFGDTAGTSDSGNATGLYLNSVGTLIVTIGSANVSLSGSQPFVPPGSTSVVWISYDSVTNIVRAGTNSSTAQLNGTSAVTRIGAGTSTSFYPFGYKTSAQCGNQAWNRWTLWNKAFLNGTVPSDDAAFANLISVYAGYL